MADVVCKTGHFCSWNKRVCAERCIGEVPFVKAPGMGPDRGNKGHPGLDDGPMPRSVPRVCVWREATPEEIEQQRQGRARSCVTEPKSILPTSSAERKDVPLYRGTVAYFPRALAYVSKVSLYGAIKHCDGVLEWRKGKSTDHADCIARHLVEHGTVDPESGLRHSGYLAWRALALLEMELEAEAAGVTAEALIGRYQEEENAK